MKTLLSVVVGLAIGLSSFGASRTLKEILKTPVKDLTPEEYVIRTEHIRKSWVTARKNSFCEHSNSVE